MDTQKPSPRAALLGNGAALIATIFFGVNILAVKMLIPRWMTAVDVTLWRILGATVLLWLVSLFVKTRSIERGDWLKLILGGAVGLFSFLYLFNLSLRYANPIDVSIILTLPPVFVVIIGILFMHHRPSWGECLGLALSLAGALVVILSGSAGHAGSNQLLGTLLALASTVCYAFYLVIIAGPSKKYRPVNMLRWVFLFAAIPALCFLPGFVKAPVFHATVATPWLWIAFCIVCPSFLSYFLLNPAIKLIGSELVSIYQYLVPVFATIALSVAGVAHLRLVQVLAMAIIVAGMLITNRAKRRRPA